MPGKRSENRDFGLLWAGALSVLFALKGLRKAKWSPSFLVLAVLFLLIALLKPRWLELPRKAWLRFGELMSRVTHPVMLAVIFYLVLTPLGVLRRLWGSPKIRIQSDQKSSYWTCFEQPRSFSDGSLRRQH